MGPSERRCAQEGDLAASCVGEDCADPKRAMRRHIELRQDGPRFIAEAEHLPRAHTFWIVARATILEQKIDDAIDEAT